MKFLGQGFSKVRTQTGQRDRQMQLNEPQFRDDNGPHILVFRLDPVESACDIKIIYFMDNTTSYYAYI